MFFFELYRLLPGIPPGKPGRPFFARLEGTLVRLEWTAPEDSGGPAIIGYVIMYNSSGSVSELYDTEHVNQVTTSYTFSGKLKPRTWYIFAVAAKYEAGEGPLSDFSDCIQTKTGYSCLFESRRLDLLPADWIADTASII